MWIMWHLKFCMSKLKRLKSNVLGDEDDLSSVMGLDFDTIDTWDDRHEDATDDLVLAAAGGCDRDGAGLNCGWCNCGGGGGGTTCCCCLAIRRS